MVEPNLLLDLIEGISPQLHFEGGFLIWTAMPPTAEQLDALNTLEGDGGFETSLETLVGRVQDTTQLKADANANIEAVPSIARRPRQADLDEPLQGFLTIEPKLLTMQPRLVDNDVLQGLLVVLCDQGDQPFQDGLEELLTERVEFTAEVRPQMDNLPEILRERLMLGRVKMRYPGVMPAQTAKVLMVADDSDSATIVFTHAVDRAAVQRLYEATLAHGMGGRIITVRARRGSAPISPPAEITYRS